jgi:hypothetical protein
MERAFAERRIQDLEGKLKRERGLVALLGARASRAVSRTPML